MLCRRSAVKYLDSSVEEKAVIQKLITFEDYAHDIIAYRNFSEKSIEF